MLTEQNPSAENADPDVDVTGGPGMMITATGQASAAVVSAPE